MDSARSKGKSGCKETNLIRGLIDGTTNNTNGWHAARLQGPHGMSFRIQVATSKRGISFPHTICSHPSGSQSRKRGGA